ncbi:MAG: glycosyltransferase [Pelotomaculum sp.]|nr:glycosyltransferase [Pelotomaculum sp.]
MVFPGKVMLISVHGDPLARLGGIQSGGQNVYVREMARALDSMGIQVDVFTHWSDPGLPRSEPLGRKSRVIRLTGGSKGFHSKHQMFGMLPMLVKELIQHVGNPCHYAVIHSNYWLSGWVGLQLQKILRIPRIHTSHSLGTVRKDAISTKGNEPLAVRLRVEREVLKKADRVIATTPFEEKILKKHYFVPNDNISVVPCGVNTELFRPLKNSKLDRRFSDQERKTVLFVGRFEENKGLGVLLKSFKILKEKYPLTAARTRLVIAGGDCLELPLNALSAEKKQYLKFIGENRISELVEFAGPLKHEDLLAYYNDASITVVPSYYESFGLVAVEAMACGCPVIASRTGGLRHNVLHGKTGLLVEPKSPEELASAINFLLTDEKARKQMSGEAAIHGKRFSWLKVASQISGIYREVTGWKEKYDPKSQEISWLQI